MMLGVGGGGQTKNKFKTMPLHLQAQLSLCLFRREDPWTPLHVGRELTTADASCTHTNRNIKTSKRLIESTLSISLKKLYCSYFFFFYITLYCSLIPVTILEPVKFWFTKPILPCKLYETVLITFHFSILHFSVQDIFTVHDLHCYYFSLCRLLFFFLFTVHCSHTFSATSISYTVHINVKPS